MTKTFEQSTVLTQALAADRLVIAPGVALTAPQGQYLTLTVNGMGLPLEPGTYVGDVRISVTKHHHMPAHGLMRISGISAQLKSALVIHDNQVVAEESTPALLQGGSYDGTQARELYLGNDQDNYNGIVVTGSGDYTVENVTMDLDGVGANDFIGVGAGITVMDNARLNLKNSQIAISGRTRCAVHVAGDAVAHVSGCRFLNHSTDPDVWMGDFSWGVGFDGSNRLVQLCDNGTAYYDNCDFITNGWGVLSIDGDDQCVRYFISNSRLSLSGPRSQGYGAFCIGSRNTVVFDHCDVHVNGYPLIVRGLTGQARATVKNGTTLSGTHYGVFLIGDTATPLLVQDSAIVTGRSSFLVKGAAARVTLERCSLRPGNGTICQMMDNDEVNMWVRSIPVSQGQTDTPIPGRDLTAIDPNKDVDFLCRDMDLNGDFYNSTTNLHLEQGCEVGMPDRVPFGGMFMGMAPKLDWETASAKDIIRDYDARGPKNLRLRLENARYEGVASSAVECHRPDVNELSERTRLELSNVCQTPAPTVNNGVVVSLDENSTWLVTGAAYLTRLTVAPGGIVKATGGKRLQVLVDGAAVELGREGCDLVGGIQLRLI